MTTMDENTAPIARTIPLQLTEGTYQALTELARDTDAGDIGELMTDALRTYEWLVKHQQAGRTIVVLEQADMEVLRGTRLLEGTRETLVSLLKADAAASHQTGVAR